MTLSPAAMADGVRRRAVKGNSVEAACGLRGGSGANSVTQVEMSWGHLSITLGRMSWETLDKADCWQQEQKLNRWRMGVWQDHWGYKGITVMSQWRRDLDQGLQGEGLGDLEAWWQSASTSPHILTVTFLFLVFCSLQPNAFN